MIASAAAIPMAIPSVFAAPSAIVARDLSLSMSSCGALSAYNFVSTLCAAKTAAASGEAPGGASILRRYGS
jgi:hypothetical protein